MWHERRTSIELIGDLHLSKPKVSRSIPKRNQTTIYSPSLHTLNILNRGHRIVANRIAGIDHNAISAVYSYMSDIIHVTTVRPGKKDDITRLCLTFRNWTAPICIQRSSIGVVRVYPKAAYLVINPTYVSRTIESTIPARILTSPYIRNAEVFFSKKKNVSKSCIRIIRSTALHRAAMRSFNLTF